MAGDTRDPSSTPSSSSNPSNNPLSKNYETFNVPPPSANALPEGSGQNTAGAQNKPLPPIGEALGDAVKTVRLGDFKQVHMYPCVRESLMMGIGGAFGMGGIRALWGAPIPKAANWAVGTFIAAGVANYEFCCYKRRLEKAHMKRAVEIIDRKKAEKEAAAQEKRIGRRKAKEEDERLAEEAARKKTWKFW